MSMLITQERSQDLIWELVQEWNLLPNYPKLVKKYITEEDKFKKENSIFIKDPVCDLSLLFILFVYFIN